MEKGGSEAANGKDSELPAKINNLTAAQIKDVLAKFSNNNPDGVLKGQKFDSLYQQLCSEKVKNLNEIQSSIFGAFDKANNGSLTFNKFLAGFVLTTERELRLKQKLKFLFDLYDADNNCVLSVTEVVPGMLDLQRADNNNEADCYAKLVAYNNGDLTKDQVIDHLSTLMQPAYIQNTFHIEKKNPKKATY